VPYALDRNVIRLQSTEYGSGVPAPPIQHFRLSRPVPICCFRQGSLFRSYTCQRCGARSATTPHLHSPKGGSEGVDVWMPLIASGMHTLPHHTRKGVGLWRDVFFRRKAGHTRQGMPTAVVGPNRRSLRNETLVSRTQGKSAQRHTKLDDLGRGLEVPKEGMVHLLRATSLPDGLKTRLP